MRLRQVLQNRHQTLPTLGFCQEKSAYSEGADQLNVELLSLKSAIQRQWGQQPNRAKS